VEAAAARGLNGVVDNDNGRPGDGVVVMVDDDAGDGVDVDDDEFVKLPADDRGDDIDIDEPALARGDDAPDASDPDDMLATVPLLLLTVAGIFVDDTAPTVAAVVVLGVVVDDEDEDDGVLVDAVVADVDGDALRQNDIEIPTPLLLTGYIISYQT
jgi:hypothetical protein